MKTLGGFLHGRVGGALTPEEHQELSRGFSSVRDIAAGTTLVNAGETIHSSVLLLDGFMSRHIEDRSGSRQIVCVHVPGDFVDLHAFPLSWMDHDVGTLTKAHIAVMPHARLREIMRTQPELTRKLWYSTLLDATLHRQWVFRLAQLGAAARVAHFLCETNARLLAVGRSTGRRYRVPLTQAALGDVCGLTSVHCNRVLRELRERGLVTYRRGDVDILDWQGLALLGQFDAGYLYLDDGLRAWLEAGERPARPDEAAAVAARP